MRAFLAASASAIAMLTASVIAPAMAASPAAGQEATNPFFVPWTTPFKAPPFAQIKPAHFMPAFERGMAEQKAEIAKIADAKAAPTFANTIEAMERSGALLDRVGGVFYNMTSANTSPELQAIQRELAPKMAAHGDSISLNPKLWARIKALYEQRGSMRLTAEQRRLVERYHTQFVRAGAALDEAGRTRLSAINGELAKLTTQFSQNMLADTRAWELVLESEADLAGLPGFVRSALAQNAKDRGKDGKWVVINSRTSVESFLTFSTRRDLREKVQDGFNKRGDNNNQYDNKAIIAQIAALRTERAQMLGYKSFAHFQIDDTMAKTPERATELLTAVWRPALEAAKRERTQLAALAAKDGITDLQAWDWRFYAEQVRKTNFALDEEQVKPYFQLEKMLEAQFYTANRLFGLTFKERKDIPVYHPDVRVWEVMDRTGKHVGLFYGDFFARASKQSGAWMSSYRSQENLTGKVTPLVVNVCNFSKPAAGQPALLSYDEAETLFHEFGHALHGLLSNVRYPSLAGTSVSRDFVEFPAQIYEHWLGTPEILSKFAMHYRTGEALPKPLLDKIMAARNFGEGFKLVEFLKSAFVDMDVHTRTERAGLDIAGLERATVQRIGEMKEIPLRHRPTHFSHIFSGGYAAGYYSYTWSEVLDADGFEAFREAGNIFDPKVAQRLYRYVYSAGNSRDPAEAYRLFRGGDPKIEPLLKNRGLTPVRTAAADRAGS
jgi:peptidyl-dipeptidase Dcp